jgi:threonine/homoserine/homoserine lactone efflux protein
VPSLAVLLAFAIPVAVVVAIPGPAVLYIVANGIRQGRVAGIVCALGLGTGTLMHVILATLGLSAVLASSEMLFMAIKFAGAAYLTWLGASKLVRRDVPPCVIPGGPRVPWRTLYPRGLAIQVMNPSIILFIVALLPQFVDPDSGNATLQILVLGITFVLFELIGENAYAIGSGSVAKWLGRHPRANLQCGRFAGFIYATFGVILAASAVTTA